LKIYITNGLRLIIVIKDYIDEKIRNNKDVKDYAQDGTELTITKNTSGKATFRNEVRQADGTTRRLTDKEFSSKLRAETHIDELGKVSRHKNGPVEDTKAHNFAKNGFTYRNAYFEDIDRQYYKITMSVGKNGDINTIYNVGKMQQAQKNRSNSTNRGFKDPSDNKITSNEELSSTNSILSTNVDVNTTKYSIQESENNAGSFNLPISDKLSQLINGMWNQYLKDTSINASTRESLKDIKKT
jgi:excinuclease UvrABC ATPase subunit